jgi:hypothetical protein
VPAAEQCEQLRLVLRTFLPGVLKKYGDMVLEQLEYLVSVSCRNYDMEQL